MAFPEYARLNEQYPVGVLIDQLDEDHLIQGIQALTDPETYRSCQAGCVVQGTDLGARGQRASTTLCILVLTATVCPDEINHLPDGFTSDVLFISRSLTLRIY